jgi:hypothetical protein
MTFSRHELQRASRPRRLAVRTRWSMTAAAGLSVAAVAFVVALQGGDALPSTGTAAAYRAAVVTQRRPLAFPADNQFYYVRSVTAESRIIQSRPPSGGGPAPPMAFVRVEQQLWTSANRIGFSKFRTLSVQFANPASRRAWLAAGRPALGASGSGREGTLGRGLYLLGNIELTRQALLSFTTDPRKLYRRLYAAGHSPYGVFGEIGDELRNRPAPSTLRAALYRTLALVPGIRLIGPTRDAVGRRGVAASFTHDGLQDELVIDPKTATMLEERSIVADPAKVRVGLPRGATTSRTTYLQRAVTNTITAP